MRKAAFGLALFACSLPPRPVTPNVVPIDASACAVAPSPLRTVNVTPETLAAALASAQPGDLVLLATGTYAGAALVPADGTSDHPIVIASAPGATVVMRGTMTLHGRAFVQIRGLAFDSTDAQAWLQVDGSSHDVSIIGNAFDSHAPNTNSGAFVGVALTGSRVTLSCNAFGSWLGDEVSADAIDGLLIEHNDWSQASAEHALLTVVGRHVVIRKNAFRNPWQRALHITDRTDADRTEDVVVEHNTFIDSDWVSGAPNPSNDDQFRGGNEVVRFLGARGIFRDNLLVGNHAGDDWACHGILNFQTFVSSSGIDTRRYARFRVYGNTFADNATTSIIFYVGAPGLDLGDDKFENNVITNPEKWAISMCSPGVPWDTYRFSGNVVPGATLHFDVGSNAGVTVEDAQASAPSVLSANVDATPVYVDATFGARVASDFTSYGASKLEDAFGAYRLAPGSPGSGAARPLAQVTTAANAQTVIEVDDALWFSDGMGMVAGDRIRIGSATATVVARDVDARTLTLDTPITAAAGDAIVLDGFSGDPGVRPAP